MFLASAADKCGVLDYIAPKDKAFDSRMSRTKGPRVDFSAMAEDEKIAWELQKEEHERYRTLHAQYASEMKAKKYGILAPKQRVVYHHRSTDEQFDAVIMDVHLDDGPEKPYYTIKYKKSVKEVDDDGVEMESEIQIDVEKQTDADRVIPLPWDEDAAYTAIKHTGEE